MEIWQLILILVIGADALIQLARLRAEKQKVTKLDYLVKILDSEDCVDERPLAFVEQTKILTKIVGDMTKVVGHAEQLRRDLSTTYQMIGNETASIKALMVQPVKVKGKAKR